MEKRRESAIAARSIGRNAIATSRTVTTVNKTVHPQATTGEICLAVNFKKKRLLTEQMIGICTRYSGNEISPMNFEMRDSKNALMKGVLMQPKTNITATIMDTLSEPICVTTTFGRVGRNVILPTDTITAAIEASVTPSVIANRFSDWIGWWLIEAAK